MRLVRGRPSARIADKDIWLPLPCPSSGNNVTFTDFPVSWCVTRPELFVPSKGVFTQNPVSAGLPRLTIVSPNACVSATDFWATAASRSSLVATSSAAGALGAPVPDKTGPTWASFLEGSVRRGFCVQAQSAQRSARVASFATN